MYRFLLYRSHFITKTLILLPKLSFYYQNSHLHVKIFFIKTVTYLYQDKLIHSLQHAMNDL